MLLRTLCCGLLAATLAAAPAAAQDVETRPALPTYYGDTGLWFVSTAETLPKGNWSTSLFRANRDRREGLTDVSEFGVTGAFGLTERVEAFASWRVVRIDRDIRPYFIPTITDFGGVLHEYPYMRRGWSKTLGSDTYAGVKWNLVSQSRGDAMTFAIRPMIKIPTGTDWGGTNGFDSHLDFIFGRELNEKVELTANIGGVMRQDNDDFAMADSAKWGLGMTFPTRSRLRGLVEYHGEFHLRDGITALTPPYLGEDGSIAPIVSHIEAPVNLRVGAVWQSAGGWFVHGGIQHSRGASGRVIEGVDIEHRPWGADVRIGFHPGAAKYVPPPPPPPPPAPVVQAPPPAPPPANRSPEASAIKCDPCIVEVGKTSNLSVQAKDADGDPLTYRWTAPTGTFSTPTAATTVWTAPQQEGSVPAQVVVQDNKGGTGTSTVTLQVVRPPVKNYTFEDVHFDFDKYSLRPEAVKILDEAIATLRDNPDLRITVEGHTCNIGTAEYNQALGERRANAVRDYLVNRGVSTQRMTSVSYGEERPKHDNSREETRRLNRRAALTVMVQ